MQPLPTLSIAPQNSSIATVLGNQPLTIRMFENEMMRPDVVQLNPAAPLIRPLQKGVHY